MLNIPALRFVMLTIPVVEMLIVSELLTVIFQQQEVCLEEVERVHCLIGNLVLDPARKM